MSHHTQQAPLQGHAESRAASLPGHRHCRDSQQVGTESRMRHRLLLSRLIQGQAQLEVKEIASPSEPLQRLTDWPPPHAQHPLNPWLPAVPPPGSGAACSMLGTILTHCKHRC